MQNNLFSNPPVVVEASVGAPLAVVWKALTEHTEMARWYFASLAFRPEVGVAFSFYGERDGRRFPIHCRVLEVEAGRRLVHTWNYEDYPAETVVSIELFDEGASTRVRLTHAGLERIEGQPREVSPQSHEEGWSYILKTGLKEYVEGRRGAGV